MRALNVLLLKDEKPGHYNQSEGALASIERVSPVNVERIHVARSALLRPRYYTTSATRFPDLLWLAELLAGSSNLKPRSRPDVIISAGGRTLTANVLLAKRFSCANIFSGSVRGIHTDCFSAILHIDPVFDGQKPYIVGLKPSTISPPARPIKASTSTGAKDFRVAALIGGPTDHHPFDRNEFETFATYLEGSAFRWTLANSRRTPALWSNRCADLATNSKGRIEYLDCHSTGADGLASILGTADLALVTDDSTSMISEAVACRLPVMSLMPDRARPSPSDTQYLALLRQEKRYLTITAANLSDNALQDGVAHCLPIDYDQLDALAGKLKSALPKLFD